MIDRARRYLYRPGLRPLLIKAVIGSAGLRALGMGFTFLVGMQLARGLGAEGYGIYGLAMSLVAILGVPTQFGLPQLLIREVSASQARGQLGRIGGVLRWADRTVLATSSIIASAVVIWLMLFNKGPPSDLSRTILVALTLVPLIALGCVKGGALRGLQHIVKGQLPDAVIRPAVFSLLLFLATSVWTLNAAIAMALGAVSAAVALVIVAAMLRKELQAFRAPIEMADNTGAWWSSAIPMALTEGMRVIQRQAAILLLGVMSTMTTVGVYRVASSVALLVAAPIALLNVVSAPIVSRLYAQGKKEQLQKLLAWTALGMFSSTLILTAPFLFAGEHILAILFGAEFAASSGMLLALCAGININGFFGANATLLNMTGHHGRVTRASAISLAMLAILLPASIRYMDGIGAAWAVSAAMTVWNIVMWRDAARLTGLDTSVRVFFGGSENG